MFELMGDMESACDNNWHHMKLWDDATAATNR